VGVVWTMVEGGMRLMFATMEEEAMSTWMKV